MPNVYVEGSRRARPGSAIEDYVVEDRTDRVLATFKNTAGSID